MAYNTLKIDQKNHITVVTLARAEQMNALSIEMMNEICDFADSLVENEISRVVVFRAEGKHFSVGVDLADEMRVKQISDDSRLMKFRHTKIGSEMIRKIQEIDQITIASIAGVALGGGACLAAACDFRIGAENCSVGFPEVNLAMNLSWGGLPLLVHLVGPAKAKQMVILAKKEPAENLFTWGFLDKVVETDQLDSAALTMAEEYALQAPLAAQMVKRSVNVITSALDRSIMHMDADQFLYAISGEDFEEGIQAFFEKRKPTFKGN